VSYTLTTEQGQKYSGIEVPLTSGTGIKAGATKSSRVVFATLAQPIGVGKPVRIEASKTDGTVVATKDV
jgi:hypothetical protein